MKKILLSFLVLFVFLFGVLFLPLKLDFGHGSKLVKTYLHSRQIYDVLAAAPESRFPRSSEDLSSTSFFTSLVNEGALPPDWFRFMGPGRYVDPTEIDRLDKETTFWSVVADLQPHDVGAPLLVSWNLDENQLVPASDKNSSPRIKRKIAGKKGVLVLRVGGSYEWIPKKHVTWENLNPTGVTKPILHPGPPVP